MTSQILVDYLSKRPKYEFLYHQTNESIEAITSALEVNGNDQVLSICASGAQPLALLENLNKNGSITAIDNNPNQIEWTKAVLEAFKEKDKKEISELNLAPREQEYRIPDYFLRGNRLNKINRNLKKIDFEIRDVTQMPVLTLKFNKGYFSNAPVNLSEYYAEFQSGALVYIAFSSVFLPNDVDFFIKERVNSWGKRFKDYFELEPEKTKIACDLEKKYPNAGWTPAVFRRK